MGLLSIAKKVGGALVGAGKAGGEEPVKRDNSTGTTMMDKITKWNDKRMQKANAQKNAGANDLSGVVAKLDNGNLEAKKGGKVKQEGLIKVHEGERILTKAQTKKYDEGPKPTKKAPKKTVSKSGPRKRS